MRIGKWEIRRADDPEVRIPGDLAKLELRQGDVIVIKLSEDLTPVQIESIKRAAESSGEMLGHKMIVLYRGISVDVDKQAAVPPHDD